MTCYYKWKIPNAIFLFVLLLAVVGGAKASWQELPLTDGRVVVLTESSAIRSLSSDERKLLMALGLQGVTIICEGDEAELAQLLGLQVIDTTAPGPYELFAVKIHERGVQRAHFIADRRFRQDFVCDRKEGITKSETDPESSELASPEQIRSALLREAIDWAADKQPMKVAGQGAWNSIDTHEWRWIGIEGNKTHARLTITLNEFKIQDAYSYKDWYLAESRMHHEVNISDPYEENVPLIPFTTGFVGWYVQDRDIIIERDGSSSYNYLGDYGPTGTISSGSVTINIGGGITTDPGVGITAGYSRTYNQPDVTLTDQSSLASHYGKWHEDFTCPEGDYSLYPFTPMPTTTSKSSFYSYQTTIYRTTGLTTGVKLKLEPSCKVYKDELYFLGVLWSITRHWYDLGSVRYITMFKNNPPKKPDKPSLPTPVWINTTASCSTSGTDTDGDSLSFKFDWGDGSQSPYGSSTQSHMWTTGGNKGVRAMSKDSPHGDESDWSETFLLFVTALDHITISGPDSVSERSGAQYTTTAHFNDGSTQTVTPTWSENSSYANISSNGYLSASDVGGQNRPCTIYASYTDHGITKTASKYITITNIRDLDHITVEGPAQVAERSGAQYTCTAYFDDSSSSNITSSANWSENSPYASVSSGGYLTTSDVGGQDRPCQILASYSYAGRTRTDTHDVTIVATCDQPIIAPITDDVVQEHQLYTGPTPTLTQGTAPITWSLVQSPPGMTIDPSHGKVSWADPTTPDKYTITIRATNQCGSDDESWVLTVETGNYITVIIPNGGESWQRGTTKEITWNSNATGDVNIGLYKGDSFHKIISATTINDGGYLWAIPLTEAFDSDYKVKITLASDASIVDCSDNNFSITRKPERFSEGFETGDFSEHPWLHGGNAPWIITSSNVHKGMYAACSGIISDDQISVLEVTKSLSSGNMTFWRRVSSQESYDWLVFYIGGLPTGIWSGERDWAKKSYFLEAGTHTFDWIYQKDSSISNGTDRGWIDEIVFEPEQVDPLLYCWSDFHSYSIYTSNMNVTPKSYFTYNWYYEDNWMIYGQGGGFTASFDYPYDGQLELVVRHLSSASSSCPGAGYSPVTIKLNSKNIVTNYDPAENHNGSHGLVTDTWVISINAGTNTLEWVADNLCTNYWIQGIEIRYPKELMGDLNYDSVVNLGDVQILTDSWLRYCTTPNWCGGCDIDKNGVVNFVDFCYVAKHWLEEVVQ